VLGMARKERNQVLVEVGDAVKGLERKGGG
jgi:hypothetical protein